MQETNWHSGPLLLATNTRQRHSASAFLYQPLANNIDSRFYPYIRQPAGFDLPGHMWHPYDPTADQPPVPQEPLEPYRQVHQERDQRAVQFGTPRKSYWLDGEEDSMTSFRPVPLSGLSPHPPAPIGSQVPRDKGLYGNIRGSREAQLSRFEHDEEHQRISSDHIDLEQFHEKHQDESSSLVINVNCRHEGSRDCVLIRPVIVNVSPRMRLRDVWYAAAASDMFLRVSGFQLVDCVELCTSQGRRCVRGSLDDFVGEVGMGRQDYTFIIQDRRQKKSFVGGGVKMRKPLETFTGREASDENGGISAKANGAGASDPRSPRQKNQKSQQTRLYSPVQGKRFTSNDMLERGGFSSPRKPRAICDSRKNSGDYPSDCATTGRKQGTLRRSHSFTARPPTAMSPNPFSPIEAAFDDRSGALNDGYPGFDELDMFVNGPVPMSLPVGFNRQGSGSWRALPYIPPPSLQFTDPRCPIFGFPPCLEPLPLDAYPHSPADEHFIFDGPYAEYPFGMP